MSSKDWTGDYRSIYTTLGASNHTEEEREENDYYATEPSVIAPLLEKEHISKNIWECACGGGHLSKALIEKGYNVKSTDLVDRGFGIGGIDFLNEEEVFNGDILTNPPYKYALEFVEHALELVKPGRKVIMFLKLTFLEGQERRRLFDTMQLQKVYVFSKRKQCAKNGVFSGSSAVAYAWFVWVKGSKQLPQVEWIDKVDLNETEGQTSIYDFL